MWTCPNTCRSHLVIRPNVLHGFRQRGFTRVCRVLTYFRLGASVSRATCRGVCAHDLLTSGDLKPGLKCKVMHAHMIVPCRVLNNFDPNSIQIVLVWVPNTGQILSFQLILRQLLPFWYHRQGAAASHVPHRSIFTEYIFPDFLPAILTRYDRET